MSFVLYWKLECRLERKYCWPNIKIWHQGGCGGDESRESSFVGRYCNCVALQGVRLFFSHPGTRCCHFSIMTISVWLFRWWFVMNQSAGFLLLNHVRTEVIIPELYPITTKISPSTPALRVSPPRLPEPLLSLPITNRTTNRALGGLTASFERHRVLLPARPIAGVFNSSSCGSNALNLYIHDDIIYIENIIIFIHIM